MTVTITIEVEVEVELEYEPPSRGARDSLGGVAGGGPPLEPDEPEDLQIESFRIIAPSILTSEQADEALALGWKKIDSELNQEP